MHCLLSLTRATVPTRSVHRPEDSGSPCFAQLTLACRGPKRTGRVHVQHLASRDTCGLGVFSHCLVLLSTPRSRTMNNSQFRRLLVNTPRQQDAGEGKAPAAAAPKAALGARKHSSIPIMTPNVLSPPEARRDSNSDCSRQVGRGRGRGTVQADFAHQLADLDAKANPRKKVKSSAPKGTKLAAGYIDRTKDRPDEDNDELAKRVKDLEESMKSGEIDRETFEDLVQEITGGRVESTHLVRGLDRKLLERVRRGEDVLRDEYTKHEESLEEDPDVEDAFDALAREDVTTVVREKAEKKGERLKALPTVAGVKRSRNDILKELKRQREEAAAAAAEHERKYPALGPGFRKIGVSGETSRIEIDARGREVLIVIGPDGKEKRKVRKQKIEEQPETRDDLDDAVKPINMSTLPLPITDESEDEDIFAGVGSNYNPLADIQEDDDDDEEGEEEERETVKPAITSRGADHPHNLSATQSFSSDAHEGTTHEPPTSGTVQPKRNWFRTTNRDSTIAEVSSTSAADATLDAVLAKARNLDANSTLLQNLSSTASDDAASKEARLKKRAAELAASDRDLEDMDLGFGASRFDDAEDMEREGEKVKFSQWKGIGVEDNGDGEDDAKASAMRRKRGPKKKRGDKNNAEDVLKVMKRQKEKKTLG